MEEPLIEFKSITKTFKTGPILKGIDLKIGQGEFFGLIGKSGGGKTTLLRILLGFFKPTSGRIFLKGEDITENFKVLRKITGFVTQDNSFYRKLTIEENLYYYGRLYGVPGKTLDSYIPELLNLVELYEHRKKITEKLSGGMLRRVDFAIALIHNPEILIMDEPTTGLDPALRIKLQQLIYRINKAGKTILVTSHILEDLSKYCSRIGVLAEGRIKLVATPAQLRKMYPGETDFNKIFIELIKD